MASTDATPIPIKNQAYRVTFPVLDADGDLVTAAGSLDSEVSKDQGTFEDCTNEATEIATASGMYYLDLTATEMNADTVAIIVKSTGGKTTPIVLYPQADGLDRDVNVTHWNGTAVATPTTAGVPEVDVTFVSGTAQTANDNGADINTLITQIGTAGAGLTDLGGMSTAMKAEVNAEADTALTDYGANTTTPPTAAAIADQVWDEALADHVTDGTYGLAMQVLDAGTATNGDVNEITLDAGMVYTADSQPNDCYVELVSGVGAGQSRPITAFVFSTRVATVVPNWTTPPQNGTKYVIRGYREVEVKSIANSAITAASIASNAIDADALATDAVTEIRDSITATYPTNFGDMAITTTTGLVDVNDKTGFRLSATGVDDILDEAIPEPTGTFTWSGDLRTIVGWLGALSRNKQTQSSTQTALRNDADAGDISTSVTTDNGTTFTRGEWT